MGQTFFTSDTHFSDHRTLNIQKRPFTSTSEMNDLMIRRWNEVVGPDDEVWHLGDFARRADDAAGLLAQLAGRKHLIVGNNDPPGVQDCEGWASVGHYAELSEAGVPLVLCHYPFRTWNGQHRGALNLHGHSHGRLKPMPRQHDVGVDVRQWRPVTLPEILA
jgi:calcineurin-like phosphoesterase family protein